MNKKKSILWVTGTMTPDLLEALGMPPQYGGSWLVEPSRLIAADPEFQLSVVIPWMKKTGKQLLVKGINYYLIPCSYMDKMKNPSRKYTELCNEVIRQVQPDVIHIHGSEFAYSIPFAKYTVVPRVLSIQGLIGKINSDYFYGYISVPSWAGCLLPWNILRYLPMKLQHFRNEWRAESERVQLQVVDAITGCTRWDYTYSKLINPSLGYYKVDYAIRHSFSEHEWKVEECHRHTFLIGNMMVPLKGTHRAIEALAILIKKYPDAKMRIVGTNTFQSKFKTGYCRYLYQKVKKLGLLEHLEFLGPQDEAGMVNAMLTSHTYVLSSCIENGPNTMMEAMYLGLPCVCSYVGGAMQFAEENKEAAFYRFEEPEILAYEIEKIWDNDEWAQSLSKNARIRAGKFETFADVSDHFKKMYVEMISDKSEGTKE